MKKLFKKLLAMSLTAVILAGFTCSSFAEDNLSLAAETRARHDVSYYKSMYASNGSTNGLAYTFADLNIDYGIDGRITIATQGVAYMDVRVYMWGKYNYLGIEGMIQYLKGHENYSPTNSEYSVSSTSNVEEKFYMTDRSDLVVMKNRYGVKVCENTVAYWNGTSTELND